MPMQLCISLDGWSEQFAGSKPRTVVTIGNFDGLHLGHQKIINRLVARALELDALATVVTFDPHPTRVLRPEHAPPLIFPLEHRLFGLEHMAVDATLVLPFDVELSRLSAEDFVRKILVEKLRARVILVGGNFRFGHKQLGDVKLLIELGKRFDFEVEVVPPVVMRHQIVSSTAIREAVLAGETTRAARRLGRPFCLTGPVRTGTGIGRRQVVPTLNLAAEEELLPKMGVYATETWIALKPGEGTAIGLPTHPEDRPSRVYRSVTNIGVRPTFDGTNLSIESHLFDFSAELHTGWLVVQFWVRLRDEMKFSGADALREQIHRDISSARKFFRRLDHARSLVRSHPRLPWTKGHAPEPF